MGVLSWLRKSVRSSGAAGLLGVVNEIYNPSAHSAQIVTSEQNEAIAPKPSPADKPFRLKPKNAKAEESNDPSANAQYLLDQ